MKSLDADFQLVDWLGVMSVTPELRYGQDEVPPITIHELCIRTLSFLDCFNYNLKYT